MCVLNKRNVTIRLLCLSCSSLRVKTLFVTLCPFFFTSGRRVGVSKHLGPEESEGGGLVSSSLVIRSHLSKA